MTTIKQLARKLADDKARRKALADEAGRLVRGWIADGTATEAELARELGVNRLTVRRWQGK